MIRKLELPGERRTLAFISVDKFPESRPVADEVVLVWGTGGGFQGFFKSRESRAKGMTLVHMASGVIIDSDSEPVYWQVAKSRSAPAPHIVETVSPVDINPGDKIEMFGAWWNVRYINYYVRSKRFQLQREEDEIHPLCDKTCMTVEINDGLQLRIKRIVKGGRNA